MVVADLNAKEPVDRFKTVRIGLERRRRNNGTEIEANIGQGTRAIIMGTSTTGAIIDARTAPELISKTGSPL